MEFLANHDEVSELIRAHGIERAERGDDLEGFEMSNGDEVVLVADDAEGDAPSGDNTRTLPRAELASALDQILHRLNLTELLLIPIGKWRNVFDAVAFSLAENEAWQEVDAAATVELNSRDPLLCERADFHTLEELVKALMNDAETPDQGFTILSTASPVLIDITPSGFIRITVGNRALADEVLESVAS